MIIIMLIKRRKKPITYFMSIELFFIWTTLVEIGPAVLENTILKFCQCISAIS